MARIIYLITLACKCHSQTTVSTAYWQLISVAATSLALAPNNAGAKDVGNGKGLQFTTAGCTSDADCESACCADIGTTNVGICSAEAASLQNGKTGCGFVDPNAAATIAAAKAQVAKQGFRFRRGIAVEDEEWGGESFQGWVRPKRFKTWTCTRFWKGAHEV